MKSSTGEKLEEYDVKVPKMVVPYMQRVNSCRLTPKRQLVRRDLSASKLQSLLARPSKPLPLFRPCQLDVQEMQRKEHIKEIMHVYSPKDKRAIRLIDLPKRCFIPRVSSSMLPINFVIKPKV